MSKLFLFLLEQVVKSMAKKLSQEDVKRVLDSAFDKVEDAVRDSKTGWDDKLVLPIVQALRRTLEVPDNDN